MASIATSISVNALSRTLARSLLRAARRLDRIVAPAAVPAELARFPAPASGLGSSLSFAAAVKHAFRAHRFFAATTPAGKKQLSSLQDLALAALQMANKRASALTNGTAAAAADGAATAASVAAPAAAAVRPAAVAFSVGQVFVHRQFGYRGVIVGWDASCRAGGEWVTATGTARLPHGASQPFYHVLVDVRDRPDAQVSYVAQDNIVLLTPAQVKQASSSSAASASKAFSLPPSPAAAAAARNTAAACLVVHPSAAAYLKEYLPAAGRYVPTPAIAAAYPLDDAASVQASALPMLATAAAAAKSSAPATAVLPTLSPSAAAAAAAAASRARAVVSPSLVGRSGRDGSFAAAAARLASLRASASASAAASASSSSGSESEGEGRAGLARLA